MPELQYKGQDGDDVDAGFHLALLKAEGYFAGKESPTADAGKESPTDDLLLHAGDISNIMKHHGI